MGNLLVGNYSNQKLVPTGSLVLAESTKVVVNLPPSVTYAQGSLLLLSTSVGQNATQTIVAPGSLTYILSGTNPLTNQTFTTAAIAFGANDAAIQLAINNALAVSGPGSVTVASLVVTFVGALALRPIPLMTITTSGSGSPSVTSSQAGITPGTYSLYTGSSGNPTVILEYQCSTDASGFVTIGPTSGGDEHGAVALTASCYIRGEFSCASIPNLDANALSTMKARLLKGTVTLGTVLFP